MAKEQKKSHFIPSEFRAVTEYENEFVREFNTNLSKGVKELLKTLASFTKEGLKNDFKQQPNTGITVDT